jgi:hypothetical protein
MAMSVKIGAEDVFERVYTQRFRALVAEFGEFVSYERDRMTRDIGLHLTRRLSSGAEVPSTALCWFQLKGVMASTLSPADLAAADTLRLRLEVKHLQRWWSQLGPTYLALYIQCADRFLVLNLKKHVASTWGKRILDLKQKSVTLEVPTSSVLDRQALDLIMTECDARAWASALGTEESAARISLTDYKVIWHLGSAHRRSVEHRVVFWDYQSKTRGQFWFQEREVGASGEWRDIRLHLQFMMEASDLEAAYPYISFYRTDAVLEPSVQSWKLRLGEPPPVLLRNGDLVEGVNYMDEYFLYIFGAKLDDYGESLFESVTVLERAGFIEITSGQSEWVSVAPWHVRSV